MNVEGRHYRTVWLQEPERRTVQIINQRALPFQFEILDLYTIEDVCRAIQDMYVRGAGLIGATAAFGMYLAALKAADASFNDDMAAAARMLKKTRPTASNLAWAVDRMASAGYSGTLEQKIETARLEAQTIADEDADYCRRIGLHGVEIIQKIAQKKDGKPVHILTHCNAGWLAFVDYGSALSPVYAAFDQGINVHVWVDETRPRNQGAFLTAWELGQHGVSHNLIPDNAGGHLMQNGLVDMVITGADRVTRQGDAANKIGTYLKALAAKENNVPFYVALPSSTFDFAMRDGLKEIPIEERDTSEVRFIAGKTAEGAIETVQICPDTTTARNWGFDITPARYISGLITERGICRPDEKDILALYPEYACDHNDGYVKYTTTHTMAPAIESPHWAELNNARTQLFRLGLLGVNPEGIGFGNVSIRFQGEEFLVSGTATGASPELNPAEYCLVNSFDLMQNHIVSMGPVKASSEAMTHGAVYRSCSAANCVMHIHSGAIFNAMIRDGCPATAENAAYGTPEIACAIAQCVQELGTDEGAVVLAGHDEGLIVWGPTVERALNLIVRLNKKYGG
ncbi:MAG: S-methyl-5-thioribose-1-phosphate isomerase [Treponema sp.]|jgi:methylthioribose-1-phosphate isomerase|nr:S-methyl-5-thioribose-1-phosphate isomerase [Treponema sp.]